MSNYRAVIFDFGGVISTSPLAGMRSYCDRVGVPLEALRSLFAAHEGTWSRFETGEYSQDQFCAAFEAEAASLGHTLIGTEFLSEFLGGMSMRPEMIEVVHTLRRDTDLRVGCITNNVQVSGRRRHELFDELFEVVVESSLVGVRKPHPSIYLKACELLSVTPTQSIFLDDFGVNLKAAKDLGMATIKVDETTSAIDELERLLGRSLRNGGS